VFGFIITLMGCYQGYHSRGGAEGVGYAHGLILGAVYLAVAIAAAMTVFLRSDVTA